jgi:hypothetical protein
MFASGPMENMANISVSTQSSRLHSHTAKNPFHPCGEAMLRKMFWQVRLENSKIVRKSVKHYIIAILFAMYTKYNSFHRDNYYMGVKIGQIKHIY